MLSGANAIIEKVVRVPGGWKCYLHTDDGDKAITNDWEAGDQALCQTFNIKAGVYENVSNPLLLALRVGGGTENGNGRSVYRHYQR